MNSTIIEVLAPRYSIAWYPWAVQYFFMIALAYAALWLTVPGFLFERRDWQPIARTSLLVSAISAIVAPIALLADLHQPLRFWHFYAYFTPWSWMSLGSFLLPPFICTILGLAWMVWREPMLIHRKRPDWRGRLARICTLYEGRSSQGIIRLLVLAALLFSLGIMLYTGMEIAIVIGRPLWNSLWLPPFFVGTGFVGAIGLVLLVHYSVARHDYSSIKKMVFCLLGAMVFVALIAFGWVGEGLFFQDSTVAKALASIRHSHEWRSMALWGTMVGAGSIFFIASIAFGFLSLRRSWILGGVAVHFAWMCRWTVLIEVQTVQKQTAGISEYALGWTSAGWLGVLGTFGLWIALFMLVDMYIDWRPFEAKAFPQEGAIHG